MDWLRGEEAWDRQFEEDGWPASWTSLKAEVEQAKREGTLREL